MSNINLYNILGITPDCTQSDIKTAFLSYTKIQIPDDVKITKKYAPIFKIINIE